MPFEAVDHLTIDGFRYHFNNFKRFSIPLELPQLQAIRLQPPNIDAEVQSFEGGITANDLDATGNYYRSALGMEQVGPVNATMTPQIRVGRRVDALGTTPPAVLGLTSLFSQSGRLIAGSVSGAIYEWTGTTYVLRDTLPAQVGKWLTVGNAYVAYYATAPGYSFSAVSSTGAFTDVVTSAPSQGAGCYAAAWVYNTSNAPVVYRIDNASAPTSGGFAANFVSHSVGSSSVLTSFLLDEPESFGGMFVAGNTFHFTGADSVDNNGSFYTYTIGGTPQRVAQIRDNYVVSGVLFRGTEYYGMRHGGRLYTLSGGNLTLVREFNTTHPLSAVSVLQDALWVAFEGASSTGRAQIWKYDGVSWSQPFARDITNLESVNAIDSYANNLVVALTNTTTVSQNLYEVSSDDYRQIGQLELPDVVYGVPSLEKSYIHTRIQHSALLDGQSVRVTHRLDNSTVETTDGTNSALGSVETIIPFPVETIGSRLRPQVHFTAASTTAGSTKALTAYSAGIRAAPLPPEREVWTADLMLTNSLYNDGTSDSRDALEKYERLLELKRSGRTFQAIDPFRESSATTLPRAAMMAKIDAQLPLEWEAQQLASNAGGAYLSVPIRFSQVYGDVVGPSNLDFENDAAGATAISSWTYSATTSSGSASISTAVNTFRTGNKSVALTFSGTPTLFNISQTITGLVGGRYYTVGGYIKRTLSAGQVYIEVSSTGLGVRTDELTSATDAEFDWYERTFMLPTANTALTVRLGGTSAGGAMPTGTVHFDGLRVIE